MLDEEDEFVFKSVEEWLEEVDYDDNSGYMPSDFALEFVNFIKLVEGGDPENKTPVVHYKMIDNFFGGDPSDVRDTINMCHRGIAKALSLGSLVYTSNGPVTVEDIKIGDKIYDDSGKLTKIQNKSEVFNTRMFELTLRDGRKIKVSADHINHIVHRRQKRINGKRLSYLDKRNLSTLDLLNIPLHATRKKTDKNPTGIEASIWIPLANAITYPTKKLLVDPYTLGLLLGDGSIDKITGFSRLHSHVDDCAEYLVNIPYKIGTINLNKENSAIISIPGLGSKMLKLGATNNCYSKRIPKEYLYGDIQQRTNLLKGLMDTDGTIYKNSGMSFTSVSVELANGVMELVRSLGGIASISHNITNIGCGYYYRVNININSEIFNLKRKLIRQKFNCADKVALMSIKEIKTEPSQCLMVDNATKLFLTDGYTITHNSTLKEYLILYIGVYGNVPGFGKIPYALYVSDSIENGVKKMRKSLEYRWHNSPFLQTYIPSTRFTDVRWEFINKAGRSFVVSGYGAKTGVRGTRENNSRPVLALLDDLISDSDARSATVIADVEDTVYKAIDYALHPKKRKIIWSGTPFNAKDPLYKAVESGAWKVNVYPVCEQYPCTPEEFKGSWVDRFDYGYVKRQYDKAYKAGKVETFNQELMLRIMSDEDRLIQDADIKWYKRSSILKNKGKFNFYITTDFATSELTASDFSVISVWAVDNSGNWYWVDGVLKRQLMNKNIDDLFRLCQEYKPQGVGIEVSGQQGGFIPWIQEQMMERNIYFNLASEKNANKPGIRPVTKKLDRFMTVEPWFKMGLMHFPEEMKNSNIMKEAINELTLASISGFKSKHDDFIDTISMLSVMNVWKPSEETVMVKSGGSQYWDIEDEEEVVNLDSYIV